MKGFINQHDPLPETFSLILRSRDPALFFEKDAVSVNGEYTFENVPVGFEYDLLIFRTGYQGQQRLLSLPESAADKTWPADFEVEWQLIGKEPVSTSSPTPIYWSEDYWSNILPYASDVPRGHVYDEKGELLSGVTIRATSLNSKHPFNAETITEGGVYHLSKVPAGIQIELIASLAGYTTRRKVEVYNSLSYIDGNIYDLSLIHI